MVKVMILSNGVMKGLALQVQLVSVIVFLFGEPLARFGMFCLASVSAFAIVLCLRDLLCISAGRLGQAYVAGYNCNTEEELQQVCGFRSFRT